MSFESSDVNESRLERLAREVSGLFEQIDQDTNALREATGLGCPTGCGACCENPDIDTTVLELLPAAFELARRGQAEAMLERIEVQEGSGRCAFFQTHGEGKGRCTLYSHRAGVCRLFGFASVHTRRGRELAVCRIHRAQSPEASARAEAAVLAGARAGDFHGAGSQVAGLDPALGTRPMPFNAALREALSRVLLDLDLRRAQTVVPLFPDGPNEDDEPPTTPNMPAAA